MNELLIFVAGLAMTIVIGILTVLVVEAVDRHNATPYWERKARKYERKADRLRSTRVLLSAFPFTHVISHNLAVFTDRYMYLAEECRKKQ